MSRSAERRARKVKVGGRSPLSRILLRIPMHRFPAYRWGEWKLGATQERAHGPAVGEMVIMVWDNSAARKKLPLGTIALECLGEACRGELADGISDLRSKVDGGWVEMISLVKPPPAQELNWLRRPTAGIGDLVWRGAMPKAGITALGSSTRAWSPARRRKLGRSVLRILHKVWKAYAAELADWKRHFGVDQHEWLAEGRSSVRQPRQASIAELYRRNRLEVCLGRRCLRKRRRPGRQSSEAPVVDRSRRLCRSC